MKLYIDTSHRNTLVIKLDDRAFETDTLNNRSQTLLPFIESSLMEIGKSVHDITEIEIAEGPGSFTGLRVGLSVAQALAWLLHVPLNGKNIEKGETVSLRYS